MGLTQELEQILEQQREKSAKEQTLHIRKMAQAEGIELFSARLLEWLRNRDGEEPSSSGEEPEGTSDEESEGVE